MLLLLGIVKNRFICELFECTLFIFKFSNWDFNKRN